MQNNVYLVNKPQEGYATYSFTPGCFNDIKVKDLYIHWNADKIDSWDPNAEMENGYINWHTSLARGEKTTVNITYPIDALGFDMSLTKPQKDPIDFHAIMTFVVAAGFLLLYALFWIFMIFKAIKSAYNSARGFSIEKEITREMIEYWDSCPHCGAPRKSTNNECEFCGASMIKKVTKIKEKNLKH